MRRSGANIAFLLGGELSRDMPGLIAFLHRHWQVEADQAECFEVVRRFDPR
jgi:hypothetical protein